VSEPVFLRVEQVERFHQQGLDIFGGIDRVRDHGLLESAVAQPQHVFFYEQGDLYEIAAAYAFHIAQNQPFLDGNKRAAITAALAFLKVNGITKKFDSNSLYAAMIAIAEKRMVRVQLAELLRG
jgi:death on curing protein